MKARIRRINLATAALACVYGALLAYVFAPLVAP